MVPVRRPMRFRVWLLSNRPQDPEIALPLLLPLLPLHYSSWTLFFLCLQRSHVWKYSGPATAISSGKLSASNSQSLKFSQLNAEKVLWNYIFINILNSKNIKTPKIILYLLSLYSIYLALTSASFYIFVFSSHFLDISPLKCFQLCVRPYCHFICVLFSTSLLPCWIVPAQ